MKHFDVAIIGGGPAGYKAALHTAEGGKNTALIDLSDDRIGGTCLNEGCIPVKSLAETAHLYERMNHSGTYGISAEQITLNMKAVQEVLENNTKKLRNGILTALKKAGVTNIYGSAKFKDKSTLQITFPDNTTEEITSEKFIIAAGSRVKDIPIFPVNGKTIVTSKEILRVEQIPEKLLIIGGGAIGCEFASIFNVFGSKVTLAEAMEELLPGEDEEVSRTLKREFTKKGIEVAVSVKVKSLAPENNKVSAVIEEDGNSKTEIFDIVLVSVGRSPNTSALNLENTGITLEKGFIPVNSSYQTITPHIYAAGDVVQTPMFAHTAYREGVLAAEACLGKTVPFGITINNIPRIVFSEPQTGCIGITEKQAELKGIPVKTFKRFFKSSGKAVIEQNEAGFVKLITEPETGKILGGCIIGPSATEMVHEIGLAIQKGLTAADIASFIHAHPTLTEMIGDTAMDWF